MFVSSLFFWFDVNVLDVFGLGEEYVMLVGVEVKIVKLCIIFLVSLLVGSVVLFVGVIGFVDLIVLYIVCCYLGVIYCWLIFGLVILGGIIMVIGDIIVCMILLLREIFIGVVIVLIGVLFFLYIYFKKRGVVV